MSNKKDLIHKDIEGLKSTDKIQAFTSIAKLKSKAQLAVPQLIQAIEKPEEESLKTMAIVTLGEIGPQAKDSINTLITCLQDKSEEVRIAAALSLSRIGEDCLEQLKSVLREKEGKSKFWASWAITMINPSEANEDVVNILNEFRLKSESDFENLAAIEGLGKVIGEHLVEE